MPALVAGADAKAALAQHRVDLAGAYDKLDDTAECQARQRERLAGGSGR